MKFMTIDEYRETCYTQASQPSKRTLIKLINEGELKGKKLGKFYYIDVDAERIKTGNPLVDRVLLEP